MVIQLPKIYLICQTCFKADSRNVRLAERFYTAGVIRVKDFLQLTGPIIGIREPILYDFRNPNTGNGEDHWPEYDVTTQKYIRFDEGFGGFPVEQRYVADRIHFWHHMVPYLRRYEDVCKKKTRSDGKQ